MCNVIMNTQARLQVSGPATEALERLSKKRKLSAPMPTDELTVDAFDFGDLFANVSPEEEAFPSLSWDDSDQEDETPQRPAEESLSSGLGRKRCRTAPSSLSVLMRSKSFKMGLSTTVEQDQSKSSSTLSFSDMVSKANFDARLAFAKLDATTMLAPLEVKGC